jgi:energy-coupling factor transport system ATP-binding protein
MNAVLRLEGVTYAYAGVTVPALHDVSLTVEPGEFVVLAGGTGSGKSTVLQVACGLVPHFHGGTFAGRAVAAGLDTREHGPAALAAAVGTLFQEPETQVVLGSVRAELAFPLENRGLGAAAVARGVEEAALALGIAGLLDRPTSELSGGELQRVAIAIAHALRSELLLADEPTSALDVTVQAEVLEIVREIRRSEGMGLLLISHDLAVVAENTDRLLVMQAGHVVEAGPTAAVVDAPAEAYTRALFDAVPTLSAPEAA